MKEKWEGLFTDVKTGIKPEDIRTKIKDYYEKYLIYPGSVQKKSNTIFFIAMEQDAKVLVLSGSNEYFDIFCGKEKKLGEKNVKVCALNHKNCVKIRELFSYTNPTSRGNKRFSIGLGDRLGIATPGHIRTIKGHDVFPILAQQSIRELKLTGRTYSDVLDDVSWAVFQEGYKDGFGADADHLKTREEVKMGLDCGYTMITLDCSEYINNKYFNTDANELKKDYEALTETYRKEIESNYLNKSFKIKNADISFNKNVLMRTVLVYSPAIDFIKSIYDELILTAKRKIDFEVSIDETSVPTAPEAHYFIGFELKKRGVKADNMAPRFCGEFQKGIDYIGDIKEFEKQFIIHEKIADHFGYRLSIHSGSDKFKVFPCIGKHTKLNVHVKTAGTNWLEAVKVIAECAPALFRKMYKHALARLNEAKKYYHVNTKAEILPDINKMDDKDLITLLEKDDSRQLLHITYGILLQEKDEDGKYVFRDEIYRILYEYEDEYCCKLEKHIGKHLSSLGVNKQIHTRRKKEHDKTAVESEFK